MFRRTGSWFTCAASSQLIQRLKVLYPNNTFKEVVLSLGTSVFALDTNVYGGSLSPVAGAHPYFSLKTWRNLPEETRASLSEIVEHYRANAAEFTLDETLSCIERITPEGMSVYYIDPNKLRMGSPRTPSWATEAPSPFHP